MIAGWVLIPVLRRMKAGQVISTDAPGRHQAKGGTPTMGGLLILCGALAAAILYPRPSGSAALLAAVLLCTLAFGAIGFLDDYLIVRRGKSLGLRAREKLALQIIVALAFASWSQYADPAGLRIGESWLDWPRVFWVLFHTGLLVGFSNAVNLTDGLDGLAAGVSLPVWLALGVAAAFWPLAAAPLGAGVSDYGLVAVCGGFAGATLGYLWYNAHPAQVFMGDTGALAIGGAMAAVAIVLRLELLLLIAAAVHLVEAGSVMLQVASFKTRGKRIFRMSPLHHHFELVEWPETRIVARFTLASAGFAALALCLFFRQGS
jgi:phospho-N-acetylmuramoyl-pentapeptide-transferase